MASTFIIVILAILLIVGVVRSIKERAQNKKAENSTGQDQEAPYQISQEEDHSNYQEVYASEEAQTEVIVEKTPAPKEKKAPVAKKTPAKKEAAPKKPAPKKPAAKKAPAKKPTK